MTREEALRRIGEEFEKEAQYALRQSTEDTLWDIRDAAEWNTDQKRHLVRIGALALAGLMAMTPGPSPENKYTPNPSKEEL